MGFGACLGYSLQVVAAAAAPEREWSCPPITGAWATAAAEGTLVLSDRVSTKRNDETGDESAPAESRSSVPRAPLRYYAYTLYMQSRTSYDPHTPRVQCILKPTISQNIESLSFNPHQPCGAIINIRS